MPMITRLALAACAGLLAGVSAGAQEMIDGTDPEAVVNLVRGYGSATLEKAADDTPMVRGRIEGTGFVIYFYGCDDDDVNCRSVGFRASWNADATTVEAVNGWNRDKRFGRAFLDEEGDPVLEMDVNLFGSVTSVNFDDTVDWWRIIMADFQTNVVEPSRTEANPDEGSLSPTSERDA